MKYKKKPIEIDAFKYTDKRGFLKWLINDLNMDTVSIQSIFSYNNGLFIKTLEGTMSVSNGDYIICGINGEFYPCKPDIFRKTYINLDGSEIEE